MELGVQDLQISPGKTWIDMGSDTFKMDLKSEANTMDALSKMAPR